MSTSTINSVINHTSDAGFRAWGQELDAIFLAAGWVATADTGQIDLTTAVRPAANTVGGYKTYYYNDGLHATSPIYLKVEFATGANATTPAWFVTTGQGTDGSGNMTGLVSTRVVCTIGSPPASTVILFPTYVSWGSGYFAIAWKAGAQSNGMGLFVVNRYSDSLGSPTSDGYCIYPRSGQQNSISYSANLVYAPTIAYSMVGGAVTNSLIGGVAQTYRHYVNTPRMQLNPYILTVINTELVTGAVFQADVIGTGLINWMPVGLVTGTLTVHNSASYGFAIPWN